LEPNRVDQTCWDSKKIRCIVFFDNFYSTTHTPCKFAVVTERLFLILEEEYVGKKRQTYFYQFYIKWWRTQSPCVINNGWRHFNIFFFYFNDTAFSNIDKNYFIDQSKHIVLIIEERLNCLYDELLRLHSNNCILHRSKNWVLIL
jgi:hypothetical protein